MSNFGSSRTKFVDGPVTFEKPVERPQALLKTIADDVVKPLTVLFDKQGDLQDRDNLGNKAGYGRALSYFSDSVAKTYGSMLENGHDYLMLKSRSRRIPERLVQASPLNEDSAGVADLSGARTGPSGKAALMAIIDANGAKGRDAIKELWSRVLLKGLVVDMQYAVLRFLAPIIMATGDSFSNRSWEGTDEPVQDALVQIESKNPYFSAVIRKSEVNTMVKYPSFYRVTNIMKYSTRWGERDFDDEMLRDLSLFEGFTPRECQHIGAIIRGHIAQHLEKLPPSLPQAGRMPKYSALSRVFNFLIKADCVQKNWFLCSLMVAKYPDWDEPYRIERPEGVENDIQFFGFNDDGGDDEECTNAYMQGIVQASFQISGLLRDRCAVNLSPISKVGVIKRMRRALRSRKILRSKRAIAWALGVRKALKGADGLAHGANLNDLISKVKINAETGPRPWSRSAAFLRAVVHARLQASGETLVFN